MPGTRVILVSESRVQGGRDGEEEQRGGAGPGLEREGDLSSEDGGEHANVKGLLATWVQVMSGPGL